LSNEPALPKGFLQHCLLLLLGEHATHGYDLVERLRPFGFDGSDPGGTYRALRAMERRNLVKSSWEDSEAGPHRRVYELTDEGRALLDRDAEELGQAHDILFNYLARYHRLINVQERVLPDSLG
jgi:poly-beta-hydroxybutyrate-responsive repressor